ncbi:putative PLP-dependent aminotransferase, partial [Flavobacteriaceae bacterium]|nr:putative PLP-dependent aminotransferase [Flavobacteriaceae bacterium]
YRFLEMKPTQSYFLWPEVQFKLSVFFGFCGIETLEHKFHEMFPSGYPVVCSSGRVALFIAVKECNLGRNQNLNLFPYSSQCVINTVARLTNPIPYKSENNCDIVYHQWGIPSKSDYIPLIEDSVDSLYERKTPLFSLGANYEIWSLPKILGTSSGGVLWCKRESDAIAIRAKMNHKTGIIFSWVQRLFSQKSSFFYNLWEGNEYGYKGISRFQRNEVYQKIKSWDEIVENRKAKLKMLFKYSILKKINFNGRLPSCLPIKTSIDERTLSKLGFSTGKRHFLMNSRLVKVFPLPIHQDVNISFLEKIIKVVENEK